MSPFWVIFIFINTWFISVFAVFPLCIKRGAHDSALDYEAAPKKIYWKKMLLLNTLIACLLTAVIALVIKTGIVPVK
ncbi:MAG: DUF1467 family protein [Rickettsiales bacterium]